MTEKPTKSGADENSMSASDSRRDEQSTEAASEVARELFQLTAGLTPEMRALLCRTLESLPLDGVEAFLDEPPPMPEAPLPLTPEQRMAGRVLLRRLQDRQGPQTESRRPPVNFRPGIADAARRVWRRIQDMTVVLPAPQPAVLGEPTEQSSDPRFERLSSLLEERERSVVLADVADELSIARVQPPGHEPVYSARLRRLDTETTERPRENWWLRVYLKAPDGSVESVRLSPRIRGATFPRTLPSDWSEFEIAVHLEE